MCDYLPMYDTVGSTVTLETVSTGVNSEDKRYYAKLIPETKLRESEYTSCERPGGRNSNESRYVRKSTLKTRMFITFICVIVALLLITTIVGAVMAFAAWKKKLDRCQTSTTDCAATATVNYRLERVLSCSTSKLALDFSGHYLQDLKCTHNGTDDHPSIETTINIRSPGSSSANTREVFCECRSNSFTINNNVNHTEPLNTVTQPVVCTMTVTLC